MQKILNAKRYTLYARNGFSLIELLITIAIIGVLGVGIWSSWVLGLQVTSQKRIEVTANALANEQIERVRSLPYSSVGTIGGIPSGTLAQQETVERNAIPFTVTTGIFFIDDPFDKTAPEDPIPTDYKRVRIIVQGPDPARNRPVQLVTDVAPPGLETALSGGTLSLTITDATAAPVSGATVTIADASANPPIALTVTTDSKGQLTLPGAPVGQEAYDITVTKDGYSRDNTIRAEVGVNPSPTKPPLSVFEGGVTKANFEIDRLGTITIKTTDDRGSPQWWRSPWPYRKNITLTNTGGEDARIGTPVALDLNHTELVTTGKSLASGDDVRVVFFNGTYFEELDRINTTPWNTAETTRIWFALRRPIARGEEDEEYAVYYGNLASDAPPASPGRIFPPPAGSDTIGLWYLDEGKGSTIAKDASGYGHDGTLTNLDPQTAWVEGKFGNALSFNDGCCPQPHVRIAPTPTLANVDKVTIEAWVYPTANTGDQTILSKIDNAKSNGTYHLYQYYRSICLFVWKNPNPYDGKGCGGLITLNAWNHVAGTYDGQSIRIYINGVLAETAEKPGTLSKTQWVEVNIGRYSGHNWDPYFGRIDTVAIHSTARSDFAYGTASSVVSELSTERTYDQPNAIANVPFTLRGTKIIGFDDLGTPIFKYNKTHATNTSGRATLSTMEYDSYTVVIDGATSGYDVAATLPLPPIVLPPAGTKEEQFTLLRHRDHTLLVTVFDEKKRPLDGSSVRLTQGDLKFDKTTISGESGQTFFSPLNEKTYTLTVTKPGYTTTITDVPIHGQTTQDVTITPL